MKLDLKLRDDWQTVLTKAWSNRFNAIGIACEGLELLLPKLTFLPPKTLAVAGILAMLVGFYARHVKQKDVT